MGMEPVSRAERNTLIALLAGAVGIAVWVAVAPPHSGLDGRSLVALGIGLAGIWLARDGRRGSSDGADGTRSAAGGLEPPAGHRGRW